MAGNRELLDGLFRSGSIDLVRGGLFDTDPPPLPRPLDFDRVEGMLLGLAVGDALGNTSEGLIPSERLRDHGEIRDYRPSRRSPEGRGVPSDDTQLAFWTLEHLLEEGRLVPERLTARFCRQTIFGIGSTVKEFVAGFALGRPWFEAGPRSAGNGALMRIAPVLVPHLAARTRELWADAALAAMLTHNDRASTAACVAFTGMLWELLGMPSAPAAEWWAATYVARAQGLEGETAYAARGGEYGGYVGPLWRFVAERVPDAHARGLTALDACQSWHSGAYLLETVPSALYILARHAADPEEAIVRAVNDTRDNDTIAAIVGAAVGALHGTSGLPRRWIENLSGRTTERDDGRVFELLRQARERWGT
ncbi:MAG: ADP-ribosylglycohydrolase family protein [Acidobacteria bacterium]|nr:ADP-ribosylglycohydrolase family protein [Acidobacteriota bacterium]